MIGGELLTVLLVAGIVLTSYLGGYYHAKGQWARAMTRAWMGLRELYVRGYQPDLNDLGRFFGPQIYEEYRWYSRGPG